MVSQGLCWQVSTSKAPKKVAPPLFNPGFISGNLLRCKESYMDHGLILFGCLMVVSVAMSVAESF